MAKSIHQILIDLDKGKYLDNGGTDRALKEIEAIIMAARPSPRPPVNLTTDPQVAAFRNGYEDAIDYYQYHLKQALYGKV